MKVKLSLSLITLIVFLLACEVTVAPVDPFLTATTVTAGTNPNAVLDTATVTRAAPEYYKLNIPSSGIYYIELEGNNAELTLYDANKNAARESNSSDYFGIIGQGLKTVALDSQAISQTIGCRGACVIVNLSTAGTLYARVRASSAGSQTTYKLYVYKDKYYDSTEPANNDCGNLSTNAIVPVPIAQGYEGAIEAVEDDDCFSIVSNQSTTITLKLSIPKNAAAGAVNTTFAIKARVYDSADRLLGTLNVNPNNPQAAATVTLLAGDPINILVQSADGRAAAVLNSQYKLSFQ